MLHLYPKFAKLEVFRGSFQADWSPKKGKTTAKKLSFWISLPGSLQTVGNRRSLDQGLHTPKVFQPLNELLTCVHPTPYKLILSDLCSCPHRVFGPSQHVSAYPIGNIGLSRELFSIAHFGGLVLHFNLLSPSPVCNPSGGASTFVSSFSCLECAISNVII